MLSLCTQCHMNHSTEAADSLHYNQKPTARDLWKIVYDRRCGVIVILCDESDTSCPYTSYTPPGPTSEEIQIRETTINLLEKERDSPRIHNTCIEYPP